MSVINQMLKDLEARRNVSEHGRYISPARKGEVSWLVWLPVSLLLGMGVGLVFWHQIRSAEAEHSSVVVATPVHSSGATVTTPSAAPAVAPVAQGATPAPVLLSGHGDDPVSGGSSTRSFSTSSSAALSELPAVKASDADNTLSNAQETEGVAPVASSVVDESAQEVPEEALSTESGSEYGPMSTEEAPLPAAPPQDQLQIDEVTLSPDEEAALQRKQADQSMERGDLPKAREALYALLQAKPTDTQAREKLAALLFGAGDEAGARRVLEQGIALVPGYANFRLLSARMDMSNGQKSRALATLRGCEPSVGENMDFYATRAALAQELGDYPLAAGSYQKLTFQQPAEGRWWMGLAISYEKSGRPQAALDAYRHAQATSGLSATSREFVHQRLTRLEHTP